MGIKPIVLCSGSRAIAHIARLFPPAATIAFLRTACRPWTDRTGIDLERETLEKHGFRVLDLDVLDESAAAAMRGADVILLTGGNTLFLLSELRRTGFDQLVTALYREGKWIVGESAGALVLGPTIEPVRLADRGTGIPEMGDLTGLNLISFFPAVHFGLPGLLEDYMHALRSAYSLNLKIITIRETDCLVVRGDLVELRTA